MAKAKANKANKSVAAKSKSKPSVKAATTVNKKVSAQSKIKSVNKAKPIIKVKPAAKAKSVAKAKPAAKAKSVAKTKVAVKAKSTSKVKPSVKTKSSVKTKAAAPTKLAAKTKATSGVEISSKITQSSKAKSVAKTGEIKKDFDWSQLVTPLDDRLFVLNEKRAEKTSGGIYIPDSVSEVENNQGTVVVVGRGHLDKKGKIHPLDVQMGDQVLYPKYAGSKILINGSELLVLRESDILGVVEQ